MWICGQINVGKDGILTHDTVTRIHAFQLMSPRLEDNFIRVS